MRSRERWLLGISESTAVFSIQGGPPVTTQPDGPPIYRVLTGPDDATLCRRVSQASELGPEGNRQASPSAGPQRCDAREPAPLLAAGLCRDWPTSRSGLRPSLLREVCRVAPPRRSVPPPNRLRRTHPRPLHSAPGRTPGRVVPSMTSFPRSIPIPPDGVEPSAPTSLSRGTRGT